MGNELYNKIIIEIAQGDEGEDYFPVTIRIAESTFRKTFYNLEEAYKYRAEVSEAIDNIDKLLVRK